MKNGLNPSAFASAARFRASRDLARRPRLRSAADCARSSMLRSISSYSRTKVESMPASGYIPRYSSVISESVRVPSNRPISPHSESSKK